MFGAFCGEAAHMALSGKDRRFLRALGHHLKPVVQVGKDGVSDAAAKAADQALRDHELIKVKVGESCPLERQEAAEALAQATGAEIAQLLGRTILLYRPDPEEPGIRLPKAPSGEAGNEMNQAEKKAAPAAEKHSPAPVRQPRRGRLPHRSSKNALR